MTRVKPGQRKRTRTPKVRSGCRTCKVRKVKCDEARPACVRCTSTGRTCDGYDPFDPSQAVSVCSSPPQPVASPFGAAPEARSLQFFVEKTIGQIQIFFPDTFWNSHVLQLAFTQEGIRHALVSLAAHHERFTRTAETGASSFALQQHSLAIKALMAGPAAATSVQLASCIIFICIEVLRGQNASAIRLFMHGLRMARERSQRTDLAHSDSTMAAIQAFLRRFAVQVALIAGHVGMKLSMRQLGAVARLSDLRDKYSLPFRSLTDARESILQLVIYVLAGIADTPAGHARACRALEDWTTALRALVATQGDALSRKGMALLELHRMTLAANLQTPAADVCERNHLEQSIDFHALISCAEQALQPDTDEATTTTTTPMMPQFHMDLGVLPFLFSAVTKSRDAALQQRAIAVMRARRLQEGIWPSELTAQVAERVVALEAAAENKQRVNSVSAFFVPERTLATIQFKLPGKVHEEVMEW